MKCACPGREAERSKLVDPGAPGPSWQIRHLEQSKEQTMSQNLTLSTRISAAQSVAVEALALRFATPFTLVYECSKNIPKTATSATLGNLGRGLRTAMHAQQHVAAS